MRESTNSPKALCGYSEPVRSALDLIEGKISAKEGAESLMTRQLKSENE